MKVNEQTTQGLVLERVAEMINDCGLTVVHDRQLANTGDLRGYDDNLDEFVNIRYNFQRDYFSLDGSVVAGNREIAFRLTNGGKLTTRGVLDSLQEQLLPLRPDLHGGG